MVSYKIILLLCSAVVASGANLKKMSSPPHCTHVSKDTDYLSKFKFAYPTVYIPPGQREAYQQQQYLDPHHPPICSSKVGETLVIDIYNITMFCLNPAAVNKAVTAVCDWAAPPQVQFTLGDEYMHVVRQDPTGRYSGNVVITTYQLCSHNRTYIPKDNLAPTVTELL